RFMEATTGDAPPPPPCCEQYERPICPKRTSLKRLRRNGQRWRSGPSKSGDSPGASYAQLFVGSDWTGSHPHNLTESAGFFACPRTRMPVLRGGGIGFAAPSQQAPKRPADTIAVSRALGHNPVACRRHLERQRRI